MKSFIFFLVFFISIKLKAQNEVPKPDYQSHFYYFDKKNNKLSKLEKQQIQYGSNVPTISLKRSAEVYNYLEGKQSETRILLSDSIFFTILYPILEDPTGVFKLYKLEDFHGKRRYVTMAANKSGRKVESPSNYEVKYEVRKLPNDQFLIIPKSKLEKGEYTFVFGNFLFSFGID